MTCRALVELVTDYLENALSAVDRARFDQHLDSCPGCRRYLDQMRLTIQTLGRLSESDLPDGARDHLLVLFRDWKPGDATGGV